MLIQTPNNALSMIFFTKITGEITHLGRTKAKVVSHQLKASDLQTFRVFSQHPKLVNTLGN